MAFRLKKLELSGFKSFAKATHFDFPQPITAIVGPNGAGKSNVVESIRWVLGEQSLKSLRGKKGEDLIFSGSQSAPRLSKASVALYFDNSLHQFPIEFDEVVIGRRVYRDGQSEYLLNGSEVRLKDIIELLGSVGLGVSQHHIIGQGEADRILYASSKEKQSAFEDALGLKVYQFKRIEAERKLSKTEENMRQAQALQKEIKPHLKHLERLVERYKQAEDIKAGLEKVLKEYLARLKATLESAKSGLSSKKEKPVSELRVAEKKIEELKNKLAGLEKFEEEPKGLKEFDAELSRIRESKAKIERDLGRLEGMIEVSSSESSIEGEKIPREDVEDLLTSLDDSLSSAMDTDVIEEIYAIIQEVISKITSFLGGFVSGTEAKSGHENLFKKKKEIEAVLLRLSDEEKAAIKKRDALNSVFYEYNRDRRMAEKDIFVLESETNNLRNALGVLDLEQEKIKMKEEEFIRELEEARRFFGESKIELADAEIFNENEREKMRKELDRIKFRLEEAGGVDQAIIGEYEEIKGRDEFFAKELEDLGKAAKSLRQISRELGDKIEHDFNQGIEKINKEFQNFFETMFGGGKARLVVIHPEKRTKKEGEEDLINTEEEGLPAEALIKEGGVEIDVSLPRKKVKGLDMLSGGERALTSIALLFAMSKVNPPPFLVLDETDAALDESNSRRYSAMLKNLSATTQVITITHNRETMRQAGVLYGVTIGSDGVSRILSLRLSEAEEIAK
ncbi:MAG: AAA family ATPase [Candidatus Niyogibacteria bacterium]|nr:MAG: AAA family ATPase [Candidatus Niyogibacteria bacterium]